MARDERLSSTRLSMVALAFRRTEEPSVMVVPPVLVSWPVPAAPVPRVKVLPAPVATVTSPEPPTVPLNWPLAAWVNCTCELLARVMSPCSEVVLPIRVEPFLTVVPPV